MSINDILWLERRCDMGLFGIKTKKEKLLDQANKNLEDAQVFMDEVKNKKALTPITTSFLLKPQEEAYLQTESFLLESRSTRYFQSSGSGGGMRVMKGVYVGGSSRSGKSESKQELKVIDKGDLVLTNQRLVFSGEKESRNIPLKKVSVFESQVDSVVITEEGKSKRMYFTVPNSAIWSFVFQILLRFPDPHKLGDINLSTGIKE